jgi:hypothetical protein
MSQDEDIRYWSERAAEEKLIAASMPKGRAASLHGILADLYEQAARRKKPASPRLIRADLQDP